MSNSSSTKRDQIVGDLRELILSGKLARGTRLPQDELAQRFDSSITPVREALRVLESERLVTSEPHRGVRVAGVDFQTVKAAYIVRRLTESFAIRRATIRISAHEIRQAELLLVELNEAALQDDRQKVRELNRAFHFFFYERCGLPALVEEIDSRWRSFPWDLLLASQSSADASGDEHVAILSAVSAGDADAAATALEAHLARNFESLSLRLVGHRAPDPFDINND